jgi:hypothetical protein
MLGLSSIAIEGHSPKIIGIRSLLAEKTLSGVPPVRAMAERSGLC